MKVLSIMTGLILLSGCCVNQYNKKGFDYGLSCISPHKASKEEECISETGESSCEEQVDAVKKSIEKRQKN